MGTLTMLQPCSEPGISAYQCWRVKRFFSGRGEQLTGDRQGTQNEQSCTDPMCQIRPKLFLGSEEAERDVEALQLAGVTHILQVGAELKPSHPCQFVYKTLDVFDLPEEDIISQLPACFAFIEEALQTGAVLVHCQLGISRSASVMIAYLMRTEHLLYKDAKEEVQTVRPQINLNYGFCLQLRHLEEIRCDLDRWTGWGAQQLALAKARPSVNNFSRKRSLSCNVLPGTGQSERPALVANTIIPDVAGKVLCKHASHLCLSKAVDC